MKNQVKNALTSPNPVDTARHLIAVFQEMALNPDYASEVLTELRKSRDANQGTMLSRIACRLLPVIRRGTVDTEHALAHGTVTETYDPTYGYGMPCEGRR